MFKTARTIMQDALKSSFLKGLLVTAQEKEKVKKPTENVALKEQIKADWEQKLPGLTNENLADLLTDIDIVAEKKQADRNEVYEKNLKFVKSSRKEAEKKMMQVAMSNPLIKEPQRKILSSLEKEGGEVTHEELQERKKGYGMEDWSDEEFIGYMKRKFKVEYKLTESAQKAASLKKKSSELEKKADEFDNVLETYQNHLRSCPQCQQAQARMVGIKNPDESAYERADFCPTGLEIRRKVDALMPSNKVPLGPKERVPYPGTVTDPQPMDPNEKATGYGGDRSGVFTTPASESTSLSSKLPLSIQKMSAGNPASKTRPVDNPYEVWQTRNGEWTWKVLKKYQSPEKEATNPEARWFCMVYSPFVPDGEMGDVWVKDIKSVAKKVSGDSNENAPVEKGGGQYKNLNDASSLIPGLAKGSTEILYWNDSSQHEMLGGDTPKVNDLPKTHVLLGSIAETDLEAIFADLQGENWSPNGEAKELIKSLGLSHTSMSVGDVVKVGGMYMVVSSAGFKNLTGNPINNSIINKLPLGMNKKAEVVEDVVEDAEAWKAKVKFVSLYRVNLIYGGPEEGGWWSEWRDFEKSFPVNSFEEAEKKREELEKEYPHKSNDLSDVNGEGTWDIMYEETEKEWQSKEIPRYSSLRKKSGRSSTVVPKESIKGIYDSLAVVSTSNMSARDFGISKPSFESIDKDVEKFDDGAYVVRWGGHWYELEPEMKTTAMTKKASIGVDEKSEDKPKYNLTQYGVFGNGYVPTPNTIKTLPVGCYALKFDPNVGIFFDKMTIKTDNLLNFPETKIAEVTKEIDRFWTMKKNFNDFGFIHKRGVLMYGAPGTGKSCTLMLVADKVMKNNGIVIVAKEPGMLGDMLSKFRMIEAERPVLVIWEDLDTIINRYGEQEVLSILDGQDQVDNVVFLSTTNYPEKLDARITNRPSRFDLIVKFDPPTAASREMYLKSKLGKIIGPDGTDLVAATEGLTFAHLRELVISVYSLGYDVKGTIERLKGMKVKPTSSDLDVGTDSPREYEKSETPLYSLSRMKKQAGLDTRVLKFSTIVHENDKWSVKSESGKNMGTYETKEEAVKRLRQVEYFKHHSSLLLRSSNKPITMDKPYSEELSYQEYKKRQQEEQEEKERRNQKRMRQQEKEIAYEGTLLKDIKDIKKGTRILIIDKTKEEYIFQVKGTKETYGWATKADVEVEELPIGEVVDEPGEKAEPSGEVHRIEMRGKKWIIDPVNDVLFNTADPNEIVPFDTLTEEEMARVNKELTKGAVEELSMPTREHGDKPKEKPLVDKRKLEEIILQHHRHDVSRSEFESIHEAAEDEYLKALNVAWEQLQEHMGSLLGIKMKAKPRAVLFPTDEELQGLKDTIYSTFPEEGDKIFNDIKNEYEKALKEETDNILSQLSAKLVSAMSIVRMGMGRFVVEYEVYKVANKFPKGTGYTFAEDYPDWYEYKVTLMDDDGKVLSEWDSLNETFDGTHRLTKEEAETAAKEIKDDVEKGESPAKWFNVAGGMRKKSAKPMPRITKLPDNTELEYDPTKDDWGLRDKTDPNKRYQLKQAAKSPQEMAEDKITEIIRGLARRVGPLWQAKEFNIEKGEYVGQEMDAFVTKNLTELVTEIYEKTVRDVQDNPEEFGLNAPKSKTGAGVLPLSKKALEQGNPMNPQSPPVSQTKWPYQERATPIGFGKAQFYSTPFGQIDHCSYCTEKKKAGAEYAGKKDDKGEMFCDYCQQCEIRKGDKVPMKAILSGAGLKKKAFLGEWVTFTDEETDAEYQVRGIWSEERPQTMTEPAEGPFMIDYEVKDSKGNKVDLNTLDKDLVDSLYHEALKGPFEDGENHSGD